MAPKDSRVFMFFEHNHFTYARLPFVDCTLDLFFVVSSVAFIRVKTYCSERECEPHHGKGCIVFRPLNPVVILVLKEYGIDDLLDSRCHVYTGMFIEHLATILLALVSMVSGGLNVTYTEYECRVLFQFQEQCSVLLDCVVICTGIESIYGCDDSTGPRLELAPQMRCPGGDLI